MLDWKSDLLKDLKDWYLKLAFARKFWPPAHLLDFFKKIPNLFLIFHGLIMQRPCYQGLKVWSLETIPGKLSWKWWFFKIYFVIMCMLQFPGIWKGSCRSCLCCLLPMLPMLPKLPNEKNNSGLHPYFELVFMLGDQNENFS